MNSSFRNIFTELQYIENYEHVMNQVRSIYSLSQEDVNQYTLETQNLPSNEKYKEAMITHFGAVYKTHETQQLYTPLIYTKQIFVETICPNINYSDYNLLEILLYPIGKVMKDYIKPSSQIPVKTRKNLSTNFSRRPIVDSGSIVNSMLIKLKNTEQTIITAAWINLLSSHNGKLILFQRHKASSVVMKGIRLLVELSGDNFPELNKLTGYNDEKLPKASLPPNTHLHDIEQCVSRFIIDLKEGNLKHDLYYKALEFNPSEFYPRTPEAKNMVSDLGKYNKLMEQYEREETIRNVF